MTIEIQEPRLAELIQERMASGLYQRVDDVLMEALESNSLKQPLPAPRPRKVNFAQFISESPLAGLDVEFERAKDVPEPIDL